MSEGIVKPAIRIGYVGPSMDLAHAAYRDGHRLLGHVVEYYLSPGHLPMSPPLDVVITAPLVWKNGRMEGPCLLSLCLPPTTLIVALATVEGPSHAMFVKHALGGRCHPRILVHYPVPTFAAVDFVERIDVVCRRPGPVAEVVCAIPDALDLRSAKKDLGQIMSDTKLTEFLYVAATDRSWSTWRELADKLGFSEGTIKNKMSQFGRLAAKAGLTNPKADPQSKYRAADFVRYIQEHQSFIRAYAQHCSIRESLISTAVDNGPCSGFQVEGEIRGTRSA